MPSRYLTLSTLVILSMTQCATFIFGIGSVAVRYQVMQLFIALMTCSGATFLESRSSTNTHRVLLLSLLVSDVLLLIALALFLLALMQDSPIGSPISFVGGAFLSELAGVSLIAKSALSQLGE